MLTTILVLIQCIQILGRWMPNAQERRDINDEGFSGRTVIISVQCPKLSSNVLLLMVVIVHLSTSQTS